MNKIFTGILVLSFLFVIACTPGSKNQSEKKNGELPRIAICGLAIESSTFSPAVTYANAFRTRTGDEIFSYYPFLAEDAPDRKRAEWFPTLRGHAIPGGIVAREAYDSLMNVTLAMLKENLPYDGVFFDIHGAMSVVGLDDPEGDMIEKIREVVGKEPVISTSMDLHGNVTERLAQNTDLITCYRMAPHEDALESKQRALEN